jgi:hypothetical protein
MDGVERAVQGLERTSEEEGTAMVDSRLRSPRFEAVCVETSQSAHSSLSTQPNIFPSPDFESELSESKLLDTGFADIPPADLPST